MHTLSGHHGPVLALALTPDGQQVVAGSVDAQVSVWDLDDGRMVHRLAGHTTSVMAIAILPGDDRFVSAAADGSMILWDRAGGRLLRPLLGHKDRVGALWAPEGRVISASADRTLRVWDWESGRELACLALESSVLSLAVSAAGDLIAVGDKAGNVTCLRMMVPEGCV
jgi:WD40 repeat protein